VTPPSTVESASLDDLDAWVDAQLRDAPVVDPAMRARLEACLRSIK
jgi:hypothetical protein